MVMNNNSPQYEQKAEGSGIAQAAGQGATAVNFFGIPIETLLMAQLVAQISIQVIGYLCTLAAYPASRGIGGYLFFVFSFGLCFPIVFGPLAIYGLVIGYSVKNKKIITMSVISGALSVLLVVIPLCVFTGWVAWNH
jgi:hypothetical protein